MQKPIRAGASKVCVHVRWEPRGLVSCGGPEEDVSSVHVAGEGHPHRAKPGNEVAWPEKGEEGV